MLCEQYVPEHLSACHLFVTAHQSPSTMGFGILAEQRSILTMRLLLLASTLQQ